MTSMTTSPQLSGPQQYAVGSPIGSTTTTEAEGINFGDVTRILKQRKLTIIITSIVVYLLVVAATILIGQFAPLFTSETVFELNPPKTG